MISRRMLGAAVAAGLSFSAILWAADDPAAEKRASQLDAAKQRVAAQEHTLRYRFAAGETVRTKVTHLATVETKIQGTTQVARSRSISTKLWRITEVDAAGNITFTHMVENVAMWQQVTGREEVSYDSTRDNKPPAQYEQVAESVGVPLATIKMNAAGRVLDRKDERPRVTLSVAQLAPPLPAGPVRIGDTWQEPQEVTVHMKDGSFRKIKTRRVYALAKVEDDIATITVRTDILTPYGDDPRIEVQLVQKLSHGTLKFDLAAGRVVHQQLEQDERVLGFSGADSLMQYVARYTEEPVPPGAETAVRPQPGGTSQ
jgi:hypothetical protein